jgi:hypothetical protein
MKWRPRFSLKSLLAATAICGLFFGWFGATWVRVNHQRQIVARLQALGCKVYYDYQAEGNHIVDGKQLQGFNPLRWIFGNEVDSSVICIMAASGSGLTDSDLAQLRDLPELLDVDVSAAQITNEGIVELAKIRKLRSLSLDGANITANGLAPLESCSHLVSLTLWDAAVTDDLLEGVGNLKTVEYLQLVRTSVTSAGLGHIALLDRLKGLNSSIYESERF